MAGLREWVWRLVLPVAISVVGHDVMLFLFSAFPSLTLIPVYLSSFLRSLPISSLVCSSSSLPFHAVSWPVEEWKMKADASRAVKQELQFRALPTFAWVICYHKAIALENVKPLIGYPRVNICIEMSYEDREERMRERDATRDATNKLIEYNPDRAALIALATRCTLLRMEYKESLIMKRFCEMLS